MISFKEETAPGTPTTGYVRVYAKTDGKVYMKDDAGVETELAGTAAVLNTLADAKGDLIVATGADVFGKLSVGANGAVPIADSAQSTGIQWDTPYRRKNALINGDFPVWQRGTSFAAITSGSYHTDRWFYGTSGAAVHTASRSTDVPTVAQAGRLFNYSVLIDCTTADASLAAGDHTYIEQCVEGFNWLSLAQRTITLSFWVKATKTGTYCIALGNSGSDRSYVAEYTVSATNTWEKKTITITASPSAGTWDFTTGIGVRVRFTLASGSTFHTTAGAWQTGNFLATANQVNATDSTSNDFRITAVQLEAGSVATEFEHRSVQEEEVSCQRYYFRGMFSVHATANGVGWLFRYPMTLPTRMRATPVASIVTVGIDTNVSSGPTPEAWDQQSVAILTGGSVGAGGFAHNIYVYAWTAEL